VENPTTTTMRQGQVDLEQEEEEEQVAAGEVFNIEMWYYYLQKTVNGILNICGRSLET
jgi:hypothetical protein